MKLDFVGLRSFLFASSAAEQTLQRTRGRRSATPPRRWT